MFQILSDFEWSTLLTALSYSNFVILNEYFQFFLQDPQYTYFSGIKVIFINDLDARSNCFIHEIFT